jgi:hypothetical protein
MHATADTTDVISSRGAGRRVMRGVRLLMRYGIPEFENEAAADGAAACWKRRQL